MKNSLIIVVGLVVGVVLGGALGFLIPFGIAQLKPQDAPALSFIPMMTVPLGAVVGGVIGIILGTTKIKREKLLEDFKTESID